MSMQRKPAVKKFTFAASATGVTPDGAVLDVSQYAFAGLHANVGLNGRTINFIDNGEWGAEIVLSKVLATGFNALTQDEILRLSPSMQLTTTLDQAATGTCWLKLKS